MIARRLFAGVFAVALLVPVLGHAAEGFADGLRYVFVAAQDSRQVSVIDSRSDSVAGSLDMGLVPSQLEVAGEPGRLVAVDGASARVAVVPLQGGEAMTVPLEFVPTRLAVAGGRIVASAPASGRLAVIDVVTGRLTGQGRAPVFRDFQPVGDGDRVILAPETGDGLLLYDLTAMGVAAEVAAPRPGLGGFSALARSPNGRLIYARAAAQPVVAVVDVRGAKVVGEVPVGAGTARAYTNATGITLVLPDSAARSVTLLPSSLKGATALRGEAGMTGVYSGWFDTVAFIPSAATRSVVVVDQQGGYRGDDIALSGNPGRGTVTPDGRKLYLPLTDGNTVAVIDAEHRRLAGTVTLPGRPTMALMGRTFGICH
ncbi:MAG: YncE family protein [Bacteroidota bacterium]